MRRFGPFGEPGEVPTRKGGPGFPGPMLFAPLVFFIAVLTMRNFGSGMGPFSVMPLPMIFVFGAMAVTAGAAALFGLYRRKRQNSKPDKDAPSLDQSIVRIARSNGGNIRLGDLVEQTGLGLDEAREALEEHAKKGNLEMNVDESGAIRYRLPGES